MNKMITIAMAVMIGLTSYQTYTVHQQQQTIKELREDVDYHTMNLGVRAALGDESNFLLFSHLHDSVVCKHPSDNIKADCNNSKELDTETK